MMHIITITLSNVFNSPEYISRAGETLLPKTVFELSKYLNSLIHQKEVTSSESFIKEVYTIPHINLTPFEQLWESVKLNKEEISVIAGMPFEEFIDVKVETVESTREFMRFVFTEMFRQINERDNKIQRMQEKYSELLVENSQVYETITVDKLKIAELSEKVVELTYMQDVVLSNRIATDQYDKVELTNKLAELETLNSQLQSSISSLEYKNIELQNNYDNIKCQINLTDGATIEVLESSLRANSNLLDSIQHHANLLTDENMRNAQEIASLKNIIKASEDSRRMLSEELANLENEYKLYKLEIEALNELKEIEDRTKDLEIITLTETLHAKEIAQEASAIKEAERVIMISNFLIQLSDGTFDFEKFLKSPVADNIELNTAIERYLIKHPHLFEQVIELPYDIWKTNMGVMVGLAHIASNNIVLADKLVSILPDNHPLSATLRITGRTQIE